METADGQQNNKHENGPPPRKQTLSKLAYFFGLAFILTVISSQYLHPIKNPLGSFLLIYAIPAVFVTIVSGLAILKKAFRNNLAAIEWGLASWGVLLSGSYIIDLSVFNLLFAFDPGALVSLNRSLPFSHIGLSPWFMIALSLLVIGPAEEYLFRGFVFGGALRAFPEQHWLLLAVLASALFTLVHFYYFLIFGLASGIILPDIFAIGLAMSATYYFSGGNLLIPILLHGLFDSFGFLSLATTGGLGENMRLFMIGAGLLMAIYLARRSFLLSNHPPTSAWET
ncbi:MAG: CPBP family intramembrane metalloprotease [Candidatus Pacebacteria bacterium]|nr:CPBP family intramembrane metalloprotease [Candidatus Paceibacterota bacterium]MDR3583191.1 CPBP family intramembrane metalloprotease [Candidatus Paceibacterota bacterium]